MNNKVVLTLTVVLTLIVGILSPAFAAANSFSDVPITHWAYDNVKMLAKNGIISYGDGHFNGNRNTTRYEMAVMVANIHAKKNNIKNFPNLNPFMDVPVNHWACKSIALLAADGIEEGYGDGTFLGNKNITRYETASMIAKILLIDANANTKNNAENSFSDVPKTNENYNAVEMVVAAGIMNGYGDSTFRGEQNITRYETAMVISKLYDKLFGQKTEKSSTPDN